LALDVPGHLVQTLENLEMKKTLVALAALASISAFAQSTVTVSGVVTASALANGKTTEQVGTAAAVTTKTSNTSAFNGWTTSQISVAGTEDLGGGLKASFTVNSGISNDTSAYLGSRDTFLGLEGGFGKLQAGRFIAASSMGYHGFSGAASTAVGSLYTLGHASSAAERFGQVATTAGTAGTAAEMTGGSFERNNNQLQYTSPSFNGLTLNANLGKSSTDVSNTLDKASTKTQGVGATYAQGPLSVGFGTNKRDYQAEGAATTSGAKVNAKLNWIGASYDLGVAKLTATHVKRKDTSGAATTGVSTENANIKATSYGVLVPMGQYTFAASMYTGKNQNTIASTDDQKLKGRQLSVQYALSKRTSLYALSGVNDVKNEGTNTAGTARKETLTMVGLTHSF
jgi:predicted porin